MNIGKSIKKLLLERDWTQKHLASLLHINVQSMSLLTKQPQCSGSRLRQLSDIFGMRVSEFVALGEDGHLDSPVSPVAALVASKDESQPWIWVDANSFPELPDCSCVTAKNEKSESFDVQYHSTCNEYWWTGRDGKEVTVTHYR